MGKFKNTTTTGGRGGSRKRGSVIDVSKFNEDIKNLVNDLKAFSNNIRKDSKKILRPAGEVVAQEIQKRTPVSRRRHYRYKDGSRFATYYPGNLRRSIGDLNLQRTDGVFIGPKITGFTGGTFSGGRTDGFYARWVDRGAPAAGRPPSRVNFEDVKESRYSSKGGQRPKRFVSRGARAARPRAIAIIQSRLQQRVKQLKA